MSGGPCPFFNDCKTANALSFSSHPFRTHMMKQLRFPATPSFFGYSSSRVPVLTSMRVWPLTPADGGPSVLRHGFLTKARCDQGTLGPWTLGQPYPALLIKKSSRHRLSKVDIDCLSTADIGCRQLTSTVALMSKITNRSQLEAIPRPFCK